MELRERVYLPTRFRNSNRPAVRVRGAKDATPVANRPAPVSPPPHAPPPPPPAPSAPVADEPPVPLIPAWETKVTWGELSEGMKLIVFAQLRKTIGMEETVDFLQWDGDEHPEFVDLLKREARFYKEVDEKLQRGNAAREALMLRGCYDYDKLNAAWEAEAYKGGLQAAATSSISAIKIRKAKAFLLEFYCRDEFQLEAIKEGEDNTWALRVNERINNLPTREQIAQICEGLDDFYGTSTGWDVLGLSDITFADDEEVAEAEDTGSASGLGNVEQGMEARDVGSTSGLGNLEQGIEAGGNRKKKQRKNHRGGGKNKKKAGLSGLRNVVSAEDL